MKSDIIIDMGAPLVMPNMDVSINNVRIIAANSNPTTHLLRLDLNILSSSTLPFRESTKRDLIMPRKEKLIIYTRKMDTLGIKYGITCTSKNTIPMKISHIPSLNVDL